ncbi:MAG: phosphoribosylglycinamide formyltransferase, partial [Candidatus Rokubacteria bacterium]|nr:phosphoribosylglycinamide formyltransferase [Candidatus Rokubacteria bacterium]
MRETPLRLGVLASGRGSNLQAIIDAIEAGRLSAKIEVVLSDRAHAEALGRARRHGIKAIFVDPKACDDRNVFDSALVNILQVQQVELVCLAGFMRLLTPTFLAEFPGRIMNIHPALLPAFPGLHAQRQALEHGIRVAGCTVHLVDEGVDTGPIVLQAAVPAFDDDTEETLSARILV